MSRDRFSQIQSFLKCSDYSQEVDGDKLKKIGSLKEYIRRKSMKYFQPYEHISIDERMVPNKGRYSFRQYIKDKPTKWGMKLWVLADSLTGYTYNFDIYLGRGEVSRNGLAYDVVTKLCSPLYGQGYKLYVDNFYSSVNLFKDLIQKSIYACGTVILNRKGIPQGLKDIKQFSKEQRGKMRWVRDGELLFLQWKDNKVVTFISSMHRHRSNQVAYCNRRAKINNEFRKLLVRQPQLVKDYNKYMGGVDKSDQMIGKYKILRRTQKYWKTILYHCIDIAKVNSFILFQEFRKKHSNIPELQRPNSYSQLDFTLDLIKELGDISDECRVPLYSPNNKCQKENVSSTPESHHVVPVPSEFSRNCKRCWRLEKVQRKSKMTCGACKSHLCCNLTRNCLLLEHANV